jgi:integrase/recombinase XerD
MVRRLSTVSKGLEQYLKRLERSEDKNYYRQQKWLLEDYMEFIGGDYKQATAGDIEDWLIALDEEYSYQIVQKAYYNVKSFYDWLLKHEEIGENKAERIKIGDIIERETLQEQNLQGDYYYLDRDEIDALLRNVPNPAIRNKLLIKVMLLTGVRAGELVLIKVSDVELGENRIWVNTLKGGDDRYVYFPNSLKIELNDWISNQRDAVCQPETEHLFTNRNGNKMSRTRPNRVVRSAAEEAGINEVLYEDAAGRKHYKITSHVLRHTFAHNMLYGDSDMDLKTLSNLLGHSTTEETAETYLHPSEEAIRSKYENASRNLPI